MRKVFFALIYCLMIVSNLSAKESIILHSRNSGLFSVFGDVIAILCAYEKSYFKGVKIDFGKTGLYYDPAYGENWWNYYFQPICVGDMSEPVRSTEMGNEKMLDLSNPWIHYEMICKYIRLQPHIEQKINSFILKNFNGYYVVGVHYRGTDKKVESGRVSFDKMMKEIHLAILEARNKGEQKIKIFLATDEKKFLECVKKKYEDRLCYLEAYRAEDNIAIHTDLQRPPYRCGEEAVLDCILLSKTNFLIRTVSNLSQYSIFFNPHLKNKLINE